MPTFQQLFIACVVAVVVAVTVVLVLHFVGLGEHAVIAAAVSASVAASATTGWLRSSPKNDNTYSLSD